MCVCVNRVCVCCIYSKINYVLPKLESGRAKVGMCIHSDKMYVVLINTGERYTRCVCVCVCVREGEGGREGGRE